MCANAAILYPDHGSDTSLPLQVLSPVSTSELLEFASSTLLIVHAAIFRSRLLLAKVGSSSSASRPHASMNKDREVVLFLLAAAATCLLNFNLPVGALPNA